MDILPRSRREKLIDMGLARFDGRLIIYESVGHQDEIGDPEEQVRADLYLDLVEKYGYNTPNAVEMEKYYKIGHPHKRSDAKVDVIVKYPDGRPFLVIELKSPGDYDRYMEDSLKTQVFNIAAVENQVHGSIRYLVYHTRYWENGTLHHKTVCIDYEKYRSFEEWDKDGRENLREIPTNYGQVTVPRFIKGGEIDLRLDVTNDELQRIRMNLHNILWGGGKYQNELFFNLVGLFLVKIYDEKETEDGHPYQFQTFYTNGKPEGAKMIYDRLNGLYFKALEEYLGYSEDELRKVKDIIFDPAKVRYVVEVLQEICFTVNRFDVIGSFFESVVRGEFKQSKGQYLTHLNIVNFMVEGLQLGEMSLGLINNEKRLPYIIDPACGSGSFLIESMKHITAYILHNKRYIKKSASVKEFYETSFPTLRKNAWAKEYVYGIEVNGDLAAATKVNMVGHGDGSASIEAKDALLPFENFGLGLLQIAKSSTIYPKPVNEQFDVILTNPPFSVTVDRDTASTFPANYVQGETIIGRLSRNEESAEIPTELLFIERYYQLLRPKGRLAVVLPESVFDNSSTRDIRLFLFQYFHVKGIISLTDEAFAPYTTTKTSILFAEKKTEEEVMLWQDAWDKYCRRYKEISRLLDTYTAQPSLTVKINEMVNRFHAVIGDQFERAAASTELAERVLNDIERNDKWETSEVVVEHIKTLFLSFFDEMSEENKHILSGIIDRKRTLPNAVEEYLTRIRTTSDLIDLLEELLGDFFDDAHKGLGLEDLIEAYRDEISYADEKWWVFKKVCEELPLCTTVLAHAEELGYKRGVRGEDNRPNELFTLSSDGIIIDTETPKTILDEFLLNTRWSSTGGID